MWHCDFSGQPSSAFACVCASCHKMCRMLTKDEFMEVLSWKMLEPGGSSPTSSHLAAQTSKFMLLNP